MTEQEAIAIIEDVTWQDNGRHYGKVAEARSMAIKALEKQIPYKPQEYEDKYYSCKCGEVLLEKWEEYPKKLMDKRWGLPYCLGCGQKLDWSEV